MNKLHAVGKYLDQPRLVGKFSKSVPTILVAGGAAFTFNHIRNSHNQKKRDEFIKKGSVLAATIGSALIATRGMRPLKINGKTILRGFEGLSEKIDLKELAQKNTELIDNFVKNHKVDKDTNEILQRAKNKLISVEDIEKLYKKIGKTEEGKEFLSGENGLIPDPENIDSKHIFKEIGRLSVMGLVPVLGGMAGGVIGDRLTEKNWKEKIPNKIKEGSYQYLANIFLCNVGAGGALYMLEKAGKTTKASRAIGMIAGIMITGVIGGSAIANLIGKTCIDPIFNHGHKHKHRGRHEGLYSERKPEMLDVGLHVDDIATVAVLSGLKWIEPALPILYSISGFRAGIGYRNGNHKKLEA